MKGQLERNKKKKKRDRKNCNIYMQIYIYYIFYKILLYMLMKKYIALIHIYAYI